jgi:ATP-dependent exoDNAse (exonuclease V) beta subunit
LYPLALRIARATMPPPRSFFCVGDTKQAIYRWRGGLGEILTKLPEFLGEIPVSEHVKSWRSAQPIIDVVNQVFGHLDQFEVDDKYRKGLDAWSERFKEHSTAKKELCGYVRLESGPEQVKDHNLGRHRGEHCSHVATKIVELVQKAPTASVGVLCRTNETVARMIYELRRFNVHASEEGGTSLADSPAVELMLSLFTLADHPGHSVASSHLRNSPLQKQIESWSDAEASRELRRELFAKGYGRFTLGWAAHVAPACDLRDRTRLQQLVEMAYAFEARSTLRADDFVAWVRSQRVPDPSAANVRVMTIHAAKGLEFEAVVLPELDSTLTGRPPPFVVRRDPKTLDVNFVCRYADEASRNLMTSEEQLAFDQDREKCVEESLSLLYVAMTRAIHALYMYIPGPRLKKIKEAWYNLLRQTLARDTPWTKCSLLYEHGDPSWYQSMPAPAVPPTSDPARPARITFKPEETERGRGLDHVAPSRREGQARVASDSLFHPSEGTGLAAGTLYHAWFEKISWLDDGVPSDGELRDVAEKLRTDLPAESLRDLDKHLSIFRGWLDASDVRAVLERSTYADPRQCGFPRALVPCWTKTMRPLQVETERRFLVRDGAKFWNGSFDRIVWLGDGERTVAADLIDFKTDAIRRGDPAALEERTEHYRPQLEAYRRAVTLLAGLPLERVAARLVFTCAGRVQEI